MMTLILVNMKNITHSYFWESLLPRNTRLIYQKTRIAKIVSKIITECYIRKIMLLMASNAQVTDTPSEVASNREARG